MLSYVLAPDALAFHLLTTAKEDITCEGLVPNIGSGSGSLITVAWETLSTVGAI